MTLYLVSFAIFLLVGLPIAFALGLASLTYLVMTDNLRLLLAFPQRMIAGIDNFVLLSIPLFILAGSLMNRAELTAQLVRFAQMLVGRIKGGLAAVNVLSGLMFSGVSGAATAEASAIGSVMIPAMVRDGYRATYAAALTAAGSLTGPLIPPSLGLILYGVLTGTSIGDLFLAGILPAFLLAGLLVSYALWKARREDHPVPPPVPREARRGAVMAAIPALLLPVIIVGGIRGGVFTPTEAAAVACAYALLIGAVLMRTLTPRRIAASMLDTATLSAGIMLVVAMASMTAFVLGIERIPQRIAGGFLGITDSPLLLLLLLNLVLLVLGLFLEPLAAMILALPILSLLSPAIGMDPVQFGIMVVLNLMIGMITPPVGLVLFIVAALARAPIEGVTRAVLPLIGISVVVLAAVALVPGLTLFLPGLFK